MQMTELAIIVIVLRLVIPLIILRFPITGVLAASIIDWLDFGVLGGYEHYQILDKWLDYYFLVICAWTVRGWGDPLAKKIAWGLFAFRTVGDIVFSITDAQWLLVVFPDLFGIFYFFYIVFVQLSKKAILFSRKLYLLPVFLSIGFTKMLQEYCLHIAYPYPQITPDWVYTVLNWPLVVRFILAILAPSLVMAYLVVKARRLNGKIEVTTEKETKA